jgi:hypothetical protein
MYNSFSAEGIWCNDISDGTGKPKEPHTGPSQFLSQENKFLFEALSGETSFVQYAIATNWYFKPEFKSSYL